MFAWKINYREHICQIKNCKFIQMSESYLKNHMPVTVLDL